MSEKKRSCEIHRISQTHCHRVGSILRKTNAGRLVNLCKKCDAKYGETIGTIVNQNHD
jgi:hypothetical protein